MVIWSSKHGISPLNASRSSCDHQQEAPQTTILQSQRSHETEKNKKVCICEEKHSPDWWGLPTNDKYEEQSCWGLIRGLHICKTQQGKRQKLKNRILNENKHANLTDTYTLRVEIRQKQTASLVLLFLWRKPPSIRSQTYCK